MIEQILLIISIGFHLISILLVIFLIKQHQRHTRAMLDHMGIIMEDYMKLIEMKKSDKD
jgi:hypothetical protein